MSDTPLTDAIVSDAWTLCGVHVVSADFAKSLERKLALAVEALEYIQAHICRDGCAYDEPAAASETPRTDAAVVWINNDVRYKAPEQLYDTVKFHVQKMIGHSADIERELTATNAKIATLETQRDDWKQKYLSLSAQHGRLCDQVYEEDGETLRQTTLEAQLAEARKDQERIDEIVANAWGIVPFDRPTGCDDADVGWRVIQYHQNYPCERVVAEIYDDDPRKAIDAALCEQSERTEMTTPTEVEQAAEEAGVHNFVHKSMLRQYATLLREMEAPDEAVDSLDRKLYQRGADWQDDYKEMKDLARLLAAQVKMLKGEVATERGIKKAFEAKFNQQCERTDAAIHRAMKAEADRDAQVNMLKSEWKRECDDADKILTGIGAEEFRTEGGSLKVAAIINKVKADRDAIEAETVERCAKAVENDSGDDAGFHAEVIRALSQKGEGHG